MFDFIPNFAPSSWQGVNRCLFFMRNIEGFKKLISEPKEIIITTHHKPDADALGSSLGLAGYLTKKGHNVTVVSPTDYPEFLKWMHGEDGVVNYEETDPEEIRSRLNEAEIIFCLDFSSLDRINDLGEMVRESRKSTKVLIDHHLAPERFADFELWDVKASATAELVFELMADYLDDESEIDGHIAECLYAGIMTDTGSYRNNNTSAKAHRISGRLIELGADAYKVGKLIYDNNSLDRLKFIGFALNERLTVNLELSTAYFAISAKDLQRFSSKTGDTEGLVNYALSLKGIKLAAVIIDRTVAVKMSFRSVGDFSVNEFARKHFEGGGHKNAAGGKSDLNLDDTVKKFENAISEYADQLNPGEIIFK